jgi:hypothetical protein
MPSETEVEFESDKEEEFVVPPAIPKPPFGKCGDHTIRCAMLRIINDNGKNGASIPFGTMPTPDKIVLSTKTWEICATDESDDLSIREILFAKVSLRSGQFILKNIAPSLIDAPRICDSPVKDSIVLPFGAIFTIPGLSLCLECDETKHGQELLDPVPTAPKRNKTSPRVTKKTLAKRQKIQVDESDGPRRCYSCGLQNFKGGAYHFGELYCKNCEAPEFYAESAQARCQPLEKGITLPDLSAGKVVSYHRGKEAKRATVVETLPTLPSSPPQQPIPKPVSFELAKKGKPGQEDLLVRFFQRALDIRPQKTTQGRYTLPKILAADLAELRRINQSLGSVARHLEHLCILSRLQKVFNRDRQKVQLEWDTLPKTPWKFSTAEIYAGWLKKSGRYPKAAALLSRLPWTDFMKAVSLLERFPAVLKRFDVEEFYTQPDYARLDEWRVKNSMQIAGKCRTDCFSKLLAKCNVSRSTSDQDLVNDVQTMFEIISETGQSDIAEQ